jgi:hypothetical protein
MRPCPPSAPRRDFAQLLDGPAGSASRRAASRLRIPSCSQPAPHGGPAPCSLPPRRPAPPDLLYLAARRFPESPSSSALLPCAATPSSMASFVAYYRSSPSVLRRHLPSIAPGRSGRPVPPALNPMCATTKLPCEQTYSRRGHALPLRIPPVPRLPASPASSHSVHLYGRQLPSVLVAFACVRTSSKLAVLATACPPLPWLVAKCSRVWSHQSR